MYFDSRKIYEKEFNSLQLVDTFVKNVYQAAHVVYIEESKFRQIFMSDNSETRDFKKQIGSLLLYF